MLKAPIDRNPSRPPGVKPQFFGANRVPAKLEHIEVLPGENVPVALEKCTAQMLRQRLERAVIRRVVRVNRIIGKLGANKIVIAFVVQLWPLESRRWHAIDPQRLHPCMPDVAGIARASHARETFRHRTAIARSQKLPLLQREVRQLIEPDEQKLRAL